MGQDLRELVKCRRHPLASPRLPDDHQQVGNAMRHQTQRTRNEHLDSGIADPIGSEAVGKVVQYQRANCQRQLVQLVCVQDRQR